MSRGPDLTTQLERALLTSADAAGCRLVVQTSEMRRWASVTFNGTHHSLTLTADASPALDAWLEALPEADFTLRDHLVADLVLLAVKHEDGAVVMILEVLTVED
jgi:hypothetical protein